MSDESEFWFNKNSYRTPNLFRHGKGIKCGHNHNIKDTEYIEDVECNACKRIIKKGLAVGMLEGKAPPTYYMSNRQKKEFNEQNAFNNLHGKCPCGCNWTIRINKLKGTEFLGCRNYPKCKNTKSLII